MIETEQSIVINTPIEGIWDYVQDIQRWADLFPGCQECMVVDEKDSRWTIKVGAGGMVRTVNVLVSVDQWDGPEQVNFSYKLAAEPVVGNGSYTAMRKGPEETEVTLKLLVEGSGQMAPMWEAMCRPLMPQLAKSFAKKLKIEIEGPSAVPTPSIFAIIGNWLRKLWQAIRGKKPTDQRVEENGSTPGE